MPFTLVAFDESQASVAYQPVAALADPHVRVSGDDLWIPETLPMLAAMWVGSAATPSAARLESPTLRTLTPIDIEPIDTALYGLSNPNILYQGHAPKPIGGGEALNLKVSTGATNYTIGLAWLSDGPLAAVTGEIFTILATASASCSSHAWTNGALTFAQTLPKGRYQVVGMRAYGANLCAARLVFPGFAWRPGCLGKDAVNDVERIEFRHGRMGVWGEFDHDVPPTVDFLATGTCNSQRVFLDLIKIA
jgi:hypothetical protein